MNYKAGARHSASDIADMNLLHDIAVRQGASCGGVVKAAHLPIKATAAGRVSGFLVRYGGPDVDGDYFIKSTDFGLKDGQALPILFHHGLDKDMGSTPIGQGTVQHQPGGLWFTGWLEKRAKYLALIMKMAEQGLLGFSSGADPASVVRAPIAGKAHQFAIKAWHIREASLTPLPAAGPQATLVSAKSSALSPEQARRLRELEDIEEELDGDYLWAARLTRELDELQRSL